MRKKTITSFKSSPTEAYKTKYPLLFVHGTGMRDREFISCWGRVPAALRAQGASVFYGQQDAWGTIEDNAQILSDSLSDILSGTGAEKVNIIAHSKGGIDARLLAAMPESAGKIASITTIATPHQGSKTMSFLWRRFRPLIKIASYPVNLWFRILGDAKPDFTRFCMQFTAESMDAFNRRTPEPDGIRYQSISCEMKRASSDFFMLLLYPIIKHFDGANDGLVSVTSAMYWADSVRWISRTNRGISHMDAVDIRRRKFSDGDGEDGIADILSAYIDIVRTLKAEGF